MLGQRKVDEKSNEITANPELLKTLAISGCIATIDAMGIQTKISKTIIEGQAPENLAVLRHIALNLLKHETSAKGGIHAKQLQAAWKEEYLIKVLAAGN